MLDYGKRILIVLIIAVCIGIMFLGGTHSRAAASGLPEGWIWPTKGSITDHFGARNGKHKGTDIANALHTNIMAVSDGVVSKSYLSSSYGNVIFIDHGPEGYETVYAHLNSRLVNEGEHVRKGQVIGKMGNTGNSRGVHLHFEVHKNHWTVNKENAINPLIVLGEQRSVEVSENKNNRVDQKVVEVVSHANDNKGEVIQGYYTVKKGDTLWEIGKRYGVTVEFLKENNQLTSDLIFIDQKLSVKKNVTISMVQMNKQKVIEEYLD
ncbi:MULTISPECIES: peptidoglycan DD-metalloendopeptidase family protein [Bacillus]|uniref:peptidoglycan DD-metalloendopeptidase family protein n=1 Tax=Bacillus TaxID=1386 RepID=UPI0002EF00AA|nr:MULTISPECIES: peptidoglycan DD-metalloendopeptidase family protein [Bacillus]